MITPNRNDLTLIYFYQFVIFVIKGIGERVIKKNTKITFYIIKFHIN
jgi:hypothetical protein